MSFFPRRSACALIAGLLFLGGSLVTASPGVAASRDVLWEIISNCLDRTAVDYCGECPVPLIEKECSTDSKCANTLELWAESNNYVVIRDRKMCDCPAGFVHGIAVPRARVTGVEDPMRPVGIWSFAWNAARARISDDSVIALVVNPARTRSQDQLHVHLVRLQKDARARLAGHAASRVPRLDDIWNVAAQSAMSAGLDDYGVLVMSASNGGFLVLVDKESFERSYTEATCR
jgi:CDP-diacylglycerol pyrophosphatase